MLSSLIWMMALLYCVHGVYLHLYTFLCKDFDVLRRYVFIFRYLAHNNVDIHACVWYMYTCVYMYAKYSHELRSYVNILKYTFVCSPHQYGWWLYCVHGIYIHAYVCVYLYVFMCSDICIYFWIRFCIFISPIWIMAQLRDRCMHTCICVCLFTCVEMYVYMCRYIRVCTHVCAFLSNMDAGSTACLVHWYREVGGWGRVPFSRI